MMRASRFCLCVSRSTLSWLLRATAQRHGDRRPSTTACPGCWAIGTNIVKKYAVRKIMLVLGWLEQPRQDKSLLYRHDKANEPTKEELWCVPICLSFNSQQGPPLSGLSGLPSQLLCPNYILVPYCFSYDLHELVKSHELHYSQSGEKNR